MNHILTRLFPAQFDNVFRGNRLALWVFYALTALTLWRSQHHITAPDGGAQSIATIPLESYTQGGAASVIAVFALWGLAQLSIAIIMLIASIRYRSMVPLLWLLILFEYVGRLLVGMHKPIETISTAPGQAASAVFPVVAAAMLGLSLWPEKKPTA